MPPRIRRLNERPRTPFDGGLADNDKNKLVLPANTTTSLSQITPQPGLIAWDTTQNKVVVSDGSTFAPISSGGSPAGSTGSIQYNNSGVFAADNNLFWDSTNKRLTVGASNSAGNLPVRGTIYAATTDVNGTYFSEYVGNTNGGASYHMRRAMGTPGSPSALTNNQNIGSVFAAGWDGSGSYSSATGGMQVFASPSGASWSSTDHGSYLAFTATQPGTTTRKNVVELSIGSTGKSILGLQGIDQTHAFGLAWDGTTTFQWLLPSTQGAANTLLNNDGSGNLSWIAAPASGADTSLSNLSAPTLLNVDLLPDSPSAGAINIGSNSRWWNNIHVDFITPHASHLTVQGDLSMGGAQISAVRGLTFDTPGPGHLTMSLQSGGGDISYIFPAPQGSANSVLTNDGSGNLTWVTPKGGTGTITAAQTTLNVVDARIATTSLVLVSLVTNDATAYIKNVVPNSGSFDINLGAATTGSTDFKYTIIQNPS